MASASQRIRTAKQHETESRGFEPPAAAQPVAPAPAGPVASSGHDFAACRVVPGLEASTSPLVARPHDGGGHAMVQAKLEISQPGDPFEEEADEVAERVMRMPDEPRSAFDFSRVRIRADSEAPHAVFGTSESRSLDAASRILFEPHFGELSHVRIHDDASAASVAASIGARAYTAGSHIGFAAGEFAPDASAGRNSSPTNSRTWRKVALWSGGNPLSRPSTRKSKSPGRSPRKASPPCPTTHSSRSSTRPAEVCPGSIWPIAMRCARTGICWRRRCPSGACTRPSREWRQRIHH